MIEEGNKIASVPVMLPVTEFLKEIFSDNFSCQNNIFSAKTDSNTYTCWSESFLTLAETCVFVYGDYMKLNKGTKSNSDPLTL